jgi:phosphocarrier protein HPr
MSLVVYSIRHTYILSLTVLLCPKSTLFYDQQISGIRAMIQEYVTIKNKAGLHTRPAATITKIASKYKSSITLERNGMNVNAKSIIGVMTLAAEQYAQLVLTIEGADEQDAFREMLEYFDAGFNEAM